MKKTLIALAAVAATGAAFAQSSVTLYGVADASLAKVTGTSATLSASGAMNNGNSRIGFRGVEDLGGGLKASFTLEQNVSLLDGSTGNGGSIATSSNTNTFQRAAWMSLSGGFGELSFGRRLNPAFNTLAAWELTGAANYSVVANQFSTVTSGNRENSLIMYTTPSLNGFTVQFGHVLKGNTGSDASNDLSLRYAAGPLAVGFNYNKTEAGAKHKHLGASYNFGAFKLAGAWIDPDGAAKGFSIGGTTNVGAVALTLDIARDTNAKDTDLLLEAKYPLSKRTFAYAAYLKDGDKKAGGLGLDKTGFGLGIRHNF